MGCEWQALSMKWMSVLECSLGHEGSQSVRTKACVLAGALCMQAGLELEGRNTGCTGDSWGPRFPS